VKDPKVFVMAEADIFLIRAANCMWFGLKLIIMLHPYLYIMETNPPSGRTVNESSTGTGCFTKTNMKIRRRHSSYN
jgi:hypothetical protein